MLDSLKTYQTLKTGHISDDHAQAMTQALQDATSEVSSDWKTEIQALRSDLDDKFATKADLAVLRSDIKAALSDLKSELTHRMFLFWIGQSAVTIGIVSALKLLR